jgi:hypothetical protein
VEEEGRKVNPISGVVELLLADDDELPVADPVVVVPGTGPGVDP